MWYLSHKKIGSKHKAMIIHKKTQTNFVFLQKSVTMVTQKETQPVQSNFASSLNSEPTKHNSLENETIKPEFQQLLEVNDDLLPILPGSVKNAFTHYSNDNVRMSKILGIEEGSETNWREVMEFRNRRWLKRDKTPCEPGKKKSRISFEVHSCVISDLILREIEG